MINFIIGLVVGVILGICLLALIVSSRQNDEE